MFKKILLTTTLLAVTSCAEAAPYVGASLGVDSSHTYSKRNGATANVFAGYGSTVGASHRFYLAGELNVDATYHSQAKTILGYGMSVLPGVMVTQSTMIYARAGLDADYPYTYHYSRYGSHLGLGAQANVSGNWDVRVDLVRYITQMTNTYNLGLVYKFA